MATSKSVFSLLLTLNAFSLLFVPHDCIDANSLKVCKFDGIYNLGDSFSDTGNFIIENPAVPSAHFPYGKTFKKATGRCSNGLLMIDYIDCVEKLKTGLFMVGEIGGNDYNYPLIQGKTFEEVRSLVPKVVKAIKDAVTRVIGYGAVRVVVPGNFPIGCLPIYLTILHTNNSAHYDEFHCLKGLNTLSTYHNDQLKQAIGDLIKENPNAVIVYGDYYNAFQSVYHNAAHLGFDAASVQKSCCGVGGAYDFTLENMCGGPDVPVCPNPDERISWDGIHMTQKAYQNMANWIINDILSKLNCKD
ncbi:GDSL esterase/lipase At5g03980-like isoform X2 [Quercus robur]|uniref:GDSL esterase/lipase At5g03980-like isoform X2 n=1 Tax=Quercus robur TaxID=38942 RepID=UPI002163AAB7|nr:GDSL esterase/lipase At5g03980-like isoform X2 [Quercus robur]